MRRPPILQVVLRTMQSPDIDRDLAAIEERDWHTLSVADVAATLQTDPTNGLTHTEAARRQRLFGPNALTEIKGRSLLTILVDQFKSLIVALLVAATAVAFMLGENPHALNARSPRRSAFTARLFTNAWLWAAVAACLLLQVAAVYTPLLPVVLQTTSLSGAEWGLVLACSLVPVGVAELVKLWTSAPARSWSRHDERKSPPPGRSDHG